MSNHLPRQPSVLGYGRKRTEQQDIRHKPSAKTWAPRLADYATFSSSPPRSSSPPQSPYSNYSYANAHIRSSPEIAPDITFRGVGDHTEDPIPWTHRYAPYAPAKYSASAYTRLPQQRQYPSDLDYPPQSDFDISEYSEDVELDLESEPTSEGTPGQSSGVYSDSEEEGTREDEDAFRYSFGYASNRTTFFRTSAERGQWKSNPMPPRPAPSLLQTRKSLPNVSRAVTPVTSSMETAPRTISEPAASVPTAKFDFTVQKADLPDRAIEGTTSDSASIPINPPTEEETDSPQTLSSLTSDRGSSVGADYHDVPSSPLPSSSPPTSPAFYGSRFSRSVSPIILDRESSLTRSSSPLSELPDDDDDALTLADDFDDKDLVLPTLSVESKIEDEAPPSSEPTQQALSAPMQSETESILGSEENGPDASSPAIIKNALSDSKSTPGPVQPEDVTMVTGETASSSHSTANVLHIESIAPKEVEKRKNQSSEGPVKKKRKLEADVATPSSAAQKSTAKKTVDDNEHEKENEAISEPSVRKSKKETAAKAEGSASSTTKRGSRVRRSKPRASSIYNEAPEAGDHDSPLDDETVALHAQVCGMLIEAMAMSRASSLPVSALYKLVMQTQPALKAQRTEREWLRVFDRVLHSGEAGRGSGMFGKVDSSGKDDSNRPLEAQWFYVPEMDEDHERATLIRAMMPRPAKRSETKKYKQYYWRPLGKISMWDSEDAL